MYKQDGGFTLPGEAGYEKLTLKLAERWGADVIRDSDGTVLSDEIINAGYGIYSTICIIRDHNDWAQKNMDKLQQCFLTTSPAAAVTDSVTISLMDDFFAEQFDVNSSEASLKYWQVFDRTTNIEVMQEQWQYDNETKTVTITDITPWHKYTVNFMAYRIWEEISMYNHTTNNWDKTHLMQIDPVYTETQLYLLDWMENWCTSHPTTTVVRFTSMFYNFVWIWGSDVSNRYRFTDWASYDFTVSPLALDQFEKRYGYRLTSEDFINKGKLHATHTVADYKKLDWMEFVNDFVIEFGKKLIDIVHKHNKLAYVFYDDSWIGIEPYNKRFEEFGFDGMIKCVFSGYEVRLCAGVKTKTHEIRLHPYLFPVGLGGAPTFMEGGDPTAEAKKFWNSVRRALLREPVERIGLGGYIHLVEGYPDFCDYIEKVANEFRMIRDFHTAGKPYVLKPKVAVLHSWGKLRSWTLSGHFHETDAHDLIHINESLSGLPVDVDFISFEDIENGVLDGLDVIINAGYQNSAWSGGSKWNNEHVVTALTKWVYEGGTFIGVNEPSAIEGYDTLFQMAHVLGVDKDNGERACHGKWSFEVKTIDGLIPERAFILPKEGIYLTDGKANVLAEHKGLPVMTLNNFGKGKGIYLSSYRASLANTRMLLNTLLLAVNESFLQDCITDNFNTECAYYPESKRLVVINNSGDTQSANVSVNGKTVNVNLLPYSTVIENIN